MPMDAEVKDTKRETKDSKDNKGNTERKQSNDIAIPPPPTPAPGEKRGGPGPARTVGNPLGTRWAADSHDISHTACGEEEAPRAQASGLTWEEMARWRAESKAMLTKHVRDMIPQRVGDRIMGLLQPMESS